MRNKLVQCEHCQLFATLDLMEETTDGNGYICRDEAECIQLRQANDYFDAKGG